MLHRGRDAALVASIVTILAFTLVPIEADNDLELVPFEHLVEAMARADVGRALAAAVEALANVLLFVPLGVALGLRGVSVQRAAWLALTVSAAVEAAQLFVVSGRTTAVDDVLLNTFGGALGALLGARRSG